MAAPYGNWASGKTVMGKKETDNSGGSHCSDSRLMLRLELRPLPLADNAPLPIRLRCLLKYALRVCGLRCTSVEKIQAPQALGQGGSGEAE
jgi:hypothetical protein